MARTRNEYAVPLTRPVTSQPVDADVSEEQVLLDAVASVHVDAADVLYCTWYDVAPADGDQLSAAAFQRFAALAVGVASSGLGFACTSLLAALSPLALTARTLNV